jgi:hypothetical protein
MGTWGTGPFENDDAADWVVDGVADDSWGAIREALSQAAANGDYLEAPEASVAIAAAAIVAVSGSTSPVLSVPQEAAKWAAEHAPPNESTRELARRAVNRVARESELRELWHASPGFDAWVKVAEEIAALLA